MSALVKLRRSVESLRERQLWAALGGNVTWRKGLAALAPMSEVSPECQILWTCQQAVLDYCAELTCIAITALHHRTRLTGLS